MSSVSAKELITLTTVERKGAKTYNKGEKKEGRLPDEKKKKGGKKRGGYVYMFAAMIRVCGRAKRRKTLLPICS